jgi:monoterpene epsilon-lactone hydrolase
MSLRAELLRLSLRRFFKRRGRYDTVEHWRRRYALLERFVRDLPPGTQALTVDANGVKADRITARAAERDRHILFVHGGGFVAGSPALYRGVTSRIAVAARACVLSIDYRLAPEHPFPAALEDAVTAYRWLLTDGADSRRIAVIGDSAGGGLVFALLVKLRELDLSPPAAAVGLSSWTDLALTGPSVKLNAATDPVLNVEDLKELAACYLAGADVRSPYASPAYADPARLPPTLIQVGSDEILRDDARRMAERLRTAGCQVELEVWPRMPHGWHLFAGMLPEARQAITRIGAFVRSRL